MQREIKIIANWKMHKTVEEALAFLKALGKFEKTAYIAPAYTAIHPMNQYIKENELTSIVIGAQNMHDASEGAFTGELSLEMLQDVGASFVLLGHSERRHVFGESNSFIQKKVVKALEASFPIILCVGETEEERAAGKTEDVIAEQIKESLSAIQPEQIENVTIAYEPVWAIGTGITATPMQAQDAHQFIRNVCGELWGETIAEKLSILYGGSVKPNNIKNLLEQPDIDGALVGGASLDADSFLQLIQYDQEIVQT